MFTLTTSRFGETYLRELHRDRFEREPAHAVFEREFELDLTRDDTLFVIVGADAGLLPAWLEDRLGTGSRAIVIELDELYDGIAGVAARTSPDTVVDTRAGDAERAPSHPGAMPTDGTLCLVRASEADALLSGEALEPWLFGGEVLLVESLGCRSHRLPAYRALARSLRQRLAERTHAAGSEINLRCFIDTQIRNIADNYRPARSVGAFGAGGTAIVLGGGPSLDDHLDWVAANRDGLFVIAVSRIIDRLREVGLRPDAVMAVDPQSLLYDISKRGTADTDALLVNAYHVSPQLLQQWAGPTLYTGKVLPWPSDDAPDEDNIGSAGSTVSHAAIWLAAEWGFERILLAGVDLCYAPGGATHASGSLESLCASMPANYDTQVITYRGRRAGTAMPLKLGLQELSAIGKHLTERGVTLINLAPDAALAEHVEQRSVEALGPLGKRTPLTLERDDDARHRHLLRVRHEVASAMRGLRAVRRECRAAAACLDRLHGDGTRPADFRYKHRLDALDARLERRQARWMPLIKRYGALSFARSLAPSGFEPMDDKALEAWGRGYYRIVDETAHTLLRELVCTEGRIEHRLQECAARPDLAGLLDYWRSDSTLGRVRLLDGDACPVTDPALRERLDAVRAEVAHELADDRTAYARALEREKSDPARLINTIALLVGDEERDDLARIADALAERGADYRALASWAAGQLAELEGRTAAALEHYRAILDHHAELAEACEPVRAGCETLLEDTLLRIVHLQLLGDSPSEALDGLALLAQLSDAHAQPYAHMLGLLGRHDEAIAVLEARLSRSESDWRAAAALAAAYLAAGSARSATLANELSERLRQSSRTASRTR